MCIVDKLTFATCPHTTFLPLYPCTHGITTTSPTTSPTCRPIINKYLSAPTSTCCLPCHLSIIHTIRTDYARRYLSLEREARQLDWCADDIQGELLEIQIEMEKVIADFSIEGLKYGADEKVDLRTFAESIRFHIGPVSGPVKFNAGCDRATRITKTKAKGKGNKMTRVQTRKAEARTMSKREEKVPWVIERPVRMSVIMGNEKGKGMTRVQALRSDARPGGCVERAPWACV